MNLLNSDTIIYCNNLRLQASDPRLSIQDQFYEQSATKWYQPRRLEVWLGFEF